MKRYLPRRLVVFWGTLALATPFSIALLDKPVALYFARLQAWRLLFDACAAPSLLALPLSGLYLAWAVMQKLRGQLRGETALNRVALAMSLATMAGTAAKDELKWIIGRSWPAFWLKDGIYGFHPFSNSFYYGSFPSGHTAYISAPLAVLWALQPRLRPVCGAVIALVMFGLVAGNYHYLGDVLGGLITGSVCAWGTLMLLRRD
ncbi:phosphatase PAP2 family protein [Acidocella sp.]|uniref:phosphatase PAP2 family protein n=1 Tax=Acidocella sp. TaxID=50710 RepID=UPI002635FFDC|nr:phosphatase PAP2 family protein [Acidocella sp.]